MATMRNAAIRQVGFALELGLAAGLGLGFVLSSVLGFGFRFGFGFCFGLGLQRYSGIRHHIKYGVPICIDPAYPYCIDQPL